jgi:hypothetical protein
MALSRSVRFGEEINVLRLPVRGKELPKVGVRVHRNKTASRYTGSSFAYALNFLTMGIVVA